MSSSRLAEFQATCHEYYTCYAFACSGMAQVASALPFDAHKFPNQKIFVGSTPPDVRPAQSVMSAAKALQAAQRDGIFPDVLAKSFLVRMYSDWDEHYRHLIAREFATTAADVRSDLMGDVRHVRNWIVHEKSKIGRNSAKVRVLPWRLKVGETLHITSSKFRELADCLNAMQVQITHDDPSSRVNDPPDA